MSDGPEFLPGIKSYGEFRSRLDDAEETDKISKRKDKSPEDVPEISESEYGEEQEESEEDD